MKKTDFTKALTSYFSTYLPETCGVSPNTCNSYRDAFKLLLLYFQEEKGVPANRIELRMLNRNLASDFLDWLEVQRKVSVTTRNQRLAAMKAFAHYVQYRNPEYLENCTDIIAMRPKKHEKPVTPFLIEEELKALLAQPDPSTRRCSLTKRGRRFHDMGLLIFSKNTFLKLNWTAIREKSLLMFYAILRQCICCGLV